MVKKDCYHCIHFRPRKGNICSFTKIKILEYHSYSCNEFDDDPIIKKMSESEEIVWDVEEQSRIKVKS